MYYLNDKHPRKEYAVYKRVNNATPYISNVFYDLKQVEKTNIYEWYEIYFYKK